jgi:hypothetical protein
MKKASILFSIGLGAVVLFAGSVFAESHVEVKAHVPFSFVAGKETLPAGDYDFTLDYENAPMVLGIRSKDGKSRDIVLSEAEAEPRAANDSKLVFDLIGDMHYLAAVQVTGYESKDIVPQTEIMREYARNAANEAGRNRTVVPLRKG